MEDNKPDGPHIVHDAIWLTKCRVSTFVFIECYAFKSL